MTYTTGSRQLGSYPGDHLLSRLDAHRAFATGNRFYSMV